MKITQRLALCFMIGAAALIAVPFASAQEAMRPVGQLTFTPEPIELQTDVFACSRGTGGFAPCGLRRGAGRWIFRACG